MIIIMIIAVVVVVVVLVVDVVGGGGGAAVVVGVVVVVLFLNVAVTRAKRHLAVICDSETVQTDAFIGRLLEHLNEFGEIRSGAEFDCGDAFYLTQGASGAGTKSGVNPDRPKKASSGKSSSSIGSSSFGGSSISKPRLCFNLVTHGYVWA